MRAAGRFAVLAFLGMVVAQSAWLLAVPPYRAIDEIDHVYRAAGVASGQWRLTEVSDEARGLEVAVPPDIVAAASAQCDSLPYLERGNCHPMRHDADGDAVVATAAGYYHPVFYWVTGTVARPFDGAAADYAMRVVSAVISALGVGFAAFCLTLSRAGPWTRAAFVAALTPVLIYTTIIPAPNSWEIVAGLSLWAALLALGDATPGSRRERWLVVAAVVAAAVLATPRALGPLWVVLIVGTAVTFVGLHRVLEIVRAQWQLLSPGIALVSAAAVGNVWWALSSGLAAGGSGDGPSGVAADADVAMAPHKWILEIVGTFPFRDQPAPIPVYVLYLFVAGTALWVGLQRGSRRQRIAIGLGIVLTLLVPIVFTYFTAESRGAFWQGRYGLPFIVGILPMCGRVLDRSRWAPVERVRLLPLGLGMLAAAQVMSVWNVAHDESRRPISAADPHWVTLPPWLIGALMLLACALLALVPVRTARHPWPTPVRGVQRARG